MWPFSSTVRFADLDFRTDVHSHILPGVDDGFGTCEDSSEALGLLYRAGLRRVILTPHIYPELYPGNTPETVREVFSGVSEVFRSSGMDCRIAGEHMVYEGVEESFSKEKTGSVLRLSRSSVLIEMSYAFEAANIRSFIFMLNSYGLVPVLAHPERYAYYSRDLKSIRSLIDMDVRLQLNILSLGGFYGDMARTKAELMLGSGLYTYAGTDLHSISQIRQLESLRIRKRLVPAMEKLLENNEMLWSDL